mmetsp:Transcript_39913/g.95531  ORF Transcript_39913/g.95531 Transcript_39913/m.95531 type:complete len:91 (+) Transcript_39913:205-477(+)
MYISKPSASSRAQTRLHAAVEETSSAVASVMPFDDGFPFSEAGGGVEGGGDGAAANGNRGGGEGDKSGGGGGEGGRDGGGGAGGQGGAGG